MFIASRTLSPGPRPGLPALLFAALLGLAACSTMPPEGITAVAPFEVTRYAGRWYEIARLEHFFERGLSDVSATYRLQADGSVEVINRGYDVRQQAWRQSVGRATFAGDPQRASLRVSFFEPFSAGYHVVALDRQDYRWAMVVGTTRGYLWILARDKVLAPAIRERLLREAAALGIATDELVWVDQSREDDPAQAATTPAGGTLPVR